MKQAVIDTSSLIRLNKGGVIDCLAKLYDQICIPDAVRDECTYEDLAGILQKPFLKVEKVHTLLDFETVMGRGECEAISLASDLNIPVITDDIQAYKQAENRGLRPLTTFEILRLAKNAGHITSVKSALDTMRENSEGIQDDIYEDTLRQAGEL